jgi:predicted transcriptional regulator
MYQTNISWNSLRQILESLENQGMIDIIYPKEKDKRSRVLYKIAEKGDNVLKYFDKAKSLLEVVATPHL